MRTALVFGMWCAMGSAAPAWAQPVPVIAEIRVHGNHSTPDADVVSASGLAVGQASDRRALDAAATRLRASRRFRSVEVNRRSRSIDDPDDVLVVLIVEEMAGANPDVPRPGWVSRTRAGLMWLPVLSFDEAYGLTYGVRVAAVDVLGRETRLSVPLVWGGERQAGLELDTGFSGGLVTRVIASADVTHTEHPAFDLPERRRGGQLRFERAVRGTVVVGAMADAREVRFAGARDRVDRLVADIAVDTRADPAFPRNAVWSRAEIERVAVEAGVRRRHRLDVNGAVGLPAGSALSARVFQVSATDALPAYEQAWIGGVASLRGRRPGYRVADNAAGASVAWTKPFGSPMSIARTGIRVFVDWAAVYPARTSFRDAAYDRGIGVGGFGTIGSFTVGVDVARSSDTTRVHVRAGTRF